jgi:hypothetical protein
LLLLYVLRICMKEYSIISHYNLSKHHHHCRYCRIRDLRRFPYCSYGSYMYIYICIYIYIYMNVYIYIYIHTYTYIYMYIYMYIYIYTYTCIYMYKCIYIYIIGLGAFEDFRTAPVAPTALRNRKMEMGKIKV